MKKIELIEDLPAECGNLVLGSEEDDFRKPPQPLGFDLRAADRYIKKHKLPKITDEIIEMFKD